MGFPVVNTDAHIHSKREKVIKSFNYVHFKTTVCVEAIMDIWTWSWEYTVLLPKKHHLDNLKNVPPVANKVAKSTALTYKCPPTSPHPHTIGCTGGELGPRSQLAVILAWKLAGLGERGHGTSQLQTG